MLLKPQSEELGTGGGRKMNEWLSKTWVIRIISLVLAVTTFVAISIDNQDTRAGDIGGFDSIFNSSQEVQELENIPVSIQIDDERYVVRGVPQTVNVRLQGTVSVVQSTATQRNFDVFVALDHLEAGTHVVSLEYEGISNRLSVDINPAQIEVSIEERAAGEYTVGVDFTNQQHLQPGFELVSAEVKPGTVQITSSENIIDRIAMVTAFVDVEGLGENMTFDNIPVRVYDNEGNQLNARIEPSVVSIALEVMNPSEIVPISIQTSGVLPENLRLVSLEADPLEVEVFASIDNLVNIDLIETEVIDLENISETTIIEVALITPSNARLLATESVTVTVEVEEYVEETVNDVEIKIENLDENFNMSFIDPVSGAIDIKISGFQSELEGITSSDFQLMIDLDGLQDGEHELIIEAEGPDALILLLEQTRVIVDIQ